MIARRSPQSIFAGLQWARAFEKRQRLDAFNENDAHGGRVFEARISGIKRSLLRTFAHFSCSGIGAFDVVMGFHSG